MHQPTLISQLGLKHQQLLLLIPRLLLHQHPPLPLPLLLLLLMLLPLCRLLLPLPTLTLQQRPLPPLLPLPLPLLLPLLHAFILASQSTHTQTDQPGKHHTGNKRKHRGRGDGLSFTRLVTCMSVHLSLSFCPSDMLVPMPLLLLLRVLHQLLLLRLLPSLPLSLLLPASFNPTCAPTLIPAPLPIPCGSLVGLPSLERKEVRPKDDMGRGGKKGTQQDTRASHVTQLSSFVHLRATCVSSFVPCFPPCLCRL